MTLEQNYTAILGQLGEDVSREGLLDTPKRAAKAMQYLCRGYEQTLEEVTNGALFSSDNSEMVLVKDIELYSLCEHHLLPIVGRAHVAYISNGTVVGLSKMNRIVDYFAKRPQVQERLTIQIVQELKKVLNTEDVACVIDAKHLCVNSRGIRDIESSTVTSEFGGKFKEEQVRREFLDYIKLDTQF
ncbi:MAG: GTP cyclohydrolase I FolE [Cytophagaceae bacterium]|nr:MAG: GTP cyclohydrolase I FolE [Cytophagaceae bacterium]